METGDGGTIYSRPYKVPSFPRVRVLLGDAKMQGPPFIRGTKRPIVPGVRVLPRSCPLVPVFASCPLVPFFASCPLVPVFASCPPSSPVLLLLHLQSRGPIAARPSSAFVGLRRPNGVGRSRGGLHMRAEAECADPRMRFHVRFRARSMSSRDRLVAPSLGSTDDRSTKTACTCPASSMYRPRWRRWTSV